MAFTIKRGCSLICGALAAFLLPQNIASAAEITDVADTADKRWIGGRDGNTQYKEDPFDLNIKASFAQNFKNGVISRERSTGLFEELKYKYQDMYMNFAVDIGFYHDLALTVNVPLIISQTHNYSYGDGVDESNSGVYSTTQSGFVNTVKFDPSGEGFDFIHGTGIGNIGFTLKWSPLNDERDSSVANWTIAVGYEAPTASLYDPSKVNLTTANLNNRSVDGLNVGDKAHRINFSIAMSRRMFLPKEYALDPNVKRRGFLDPYFQIFYSLPLAGTSSLRADPIAEAEDGKVSRYQPSHVAGLKAGTEIVAYEDVSAGRKVAFDIGVYGNYISEGRGYTPITDALGQLTYYENYMQVGGHVRFVVKFAEYVSLVAGVAIGHETAHFLTMENAGVDKDGDNQVIKDTVDYYSPYYRGDIDQVGSRFRFEQVLQLSYDVGLHITF